MPVVVLSHDVIKREKSDIYVPRGRTLGFRVIRAVTHVTTEMAGLVSFGVGRWCSLSSSCWNEANNKGDISAVARDSVKIHIIVIYV